MFAQGELLKQAESDARRLAIADQVRDQGNFGLAATLYAKLAASRSSTHCETAQERIAQLADHGRTQLEEIDAKLAGGKDALSSGEDEQTRPGYMADPTLRILDAFDEFDALERQYRRVPKVGQEIRTHVRKKRREPQFASVLNEPKAAKLLKLAKQYDDEGQICCAIQVYAQAAKLLPAPSAKRGERRLAEVEADPQNVAAAELCAQLQACHKTYQRAQRLIEMRPERARELFAQILTEAPADSEIYRSARLRIAELTPSSRGTSGRS